MLVCEDFDPEIWTAFEHHEQKLLTKRSIEPSFFNATTNRGLIKPIALHLQPPYSWDCEPNSLPIETHTDFTNPLSGSGDNCKPLSSKSSFKELEDCVALDEEGLDLEVWAAFEQEQKAEPVPFHQCAPSAVPRPVPVCPVHPVEGESEHVESKSKTASKNSIKMNPLRSLLRGLRKLFRRKKL